MNVAVYTRTGPGGSDPVRQDEINRSLGGRMNPEI